MTLLWRFIAAMDESEKAKVWPVEKYARFVSNAASSTAKKTDGLWQAGFLHLAKFAACHSLCLALFLKGGQHPAGSG